MSWKGEMGMTQTGFYLSTYKEAGDEEERYYAQTQFQPNGARRAFPCFDEVRPRFTRSVFSFMQELKKMGTSLVCSLGSSRPSSYACSPRTAKSGSTTCPSSPRRIPPRSWRIKRIRGSCSSWVSRRRDGWSSLSGRLWYAPPPPSLTLSKDDGKG